MLHKTAVVPGAAWGFIRDSCSFTRHSYWGRFSGASCLSAVHLHALSRRLLAYVASLLFNCLILFSSFFFFFFFFFWLYFLFFSSSSFLFSCRGNDRLAQIWGIERTR